ncbi:MAG: hypothetical protein WAN65_06955, partial [Candidatus Sulfotelmatobacter sp.]
MNKELFVSSTPHETKVGLVEDDLLAEIYLERENEYTLAGSIYKGRVTRVLPGMQSAFVDIGLERDAFLYVSDFMELEEHDEDLTDSIPAGRTVPDLWPQPPRSETFAAGTDSAEGASAEPSAGSFDQGFDETEEHAGDQSPAAAAASEPSSAGDSPDRERGGWRGRRRRRSGRRDGRGDGRDRSPEPRFAKPATEIAPTPVPPRPQEPARTQQFGPPAGYQPILLPGESISKYRGLTQPSANPARSHEFHAAEPAVGPRGAESRAETSEPIAARFPEDEPIFAKTTDIEEGSVEDARLNKDAQPVHEDSAEAAPASASTSVDWNREFHRRDTVGAGASAAAAAARTTEEEVVEEVEADRMVAMPEHSDLAPAAAPAMENQPGFAPAGTLEEETIDEEEVDTVRYEQSSDEGYDEFEEETRAAGQPNVEAQRELAEVRATVEEIHMSSLAESGVAPQAPTESEDDSEELELEEAQAEAEALLDAEAGGTGAVDTRAEVRAPSGTAGYT